MSLSSWISHIFFNCLPNLFCLDYDYYEVGLKTVATVSTCSLSSAASGEAIPTNSRQTQEDTMLKHTRRHPKKPSTPARRSNQMLKAVSPFEELLPRKGAPSREYRKVEDDDDEDLFPFDEVLVPQVVRKSSTNRAFVWYDNNDKYNHHALAQAREPEARQEPRQEELRDDAVTLVREDAVPSTIAVAAKAAGDEEDSDLSCESLSEESRTLTPHPSFDASSKRIITAKEFHYLYQASKKLEEQQDWPSDEDGPNHAEFTECDMLEELQNREGDLSTNNGMALMILKDLDDTMIHRRKPWGITGAEI